MGQRIVSVAFDSNPVILRQLQIQSPDLEYLREQFSVLMKRRFFEVCSFQEGHGMKGIAGLNSKVRQLSQTFLLSNTDA